jgi:pyruvate/2-oxoglutarate dehydrogenase complex dihydrolipoamide acyltransferase (E2) component
MKGKHVFVTVLVVLALAGFGVTAAYGARGGNGKSNSGTHGNSAAAHAQSTPTDSSHDPSNPDGTYRGKSGSTPDQDGIGADHGIDNNDKTGPGTDGNNGCGNDADREDDNNGWCGKKPANVKPTETPTATETPEVSPSATTTAEVLGETFTRPSVLGSNLARTGVALGVFMLAAMVLALFGFALRAIARPKHR